MKRNKRNGEENGEKDGGTDGVGKSLKKGKGGMKERRRKYALNRIASRMNQMYIFTWTNCLSGKSGSR